jgi:hypothetical protein
MSNLNDDGQQAISVNAVSIWPYAIHVNSRPNKLQIIPEVAWPGGHSVFGSLRATIPAVLTTPTMHPHPVIRRVCSREYLNLRSSMSRETITDM